MDQFIGWDVGGAHLKVAVLDADGIVQRVVQRACPLWRGLSQLDAAMEEFLAELGIDAGNPGTHAVTMTGELVDLFPDRHCGVEAILELLVRRLDRSRLWLFSGPRGFQQARDDSPDLDSIASANWLASGQLAASTVKDGLLVDVGSTTTDLLLLREGEALFEGLTDYQRLVSDELVYTGVVRTPVMAVADRIPFEGKSVPLMAEMFATMSDVYRLLGELPDHADQADTTDGGAKNPEGSARRLARMIGRDLDSALPESWSMLASNLRETQLARIAAACQRQLSKGSPNLREPLVGAGVGRFLVRILADRLQRRYLDFGELIPSAPFSEAFYVSDCAPAVSVAVLLFRSLTHGRIEDPARRQKSGA